MLRPILLLLAASFIVPGVEAAAKGRQLAAANMFLHTGQTLPTGRQGAGMVLLKGNVVVFGGDAGGGEQEERESARGRECACERVRCAHGMHACERAPSCAADRGEKRRRTMRRRIVALMPACAVSAECRLHG